MRQVPVPTSIGRVALDVLLGEKLIEHAGQLGEYFGERLHRIRSELVKEIRCGGLWAGIELHPEAGGHAGSPQPYAMKGCW